MEEPFFPTGFFEFPYPSSVQDDLYYYYIASMRGHRMKTLLFYAVVFYFLCRYFIADNEQPLTEVVQPPPTQKPTPQTDRNIIISLLSLPFSIIHRTFSFLWSVLEFFWSIAVYVVEIFWSIAVLLWGHIRYMWTLAMLFVNVAYLTATVYLMNRRRSKSVEYFLELVLIYLVGPTLVNYFLVKKEVAFNLLFPIYLAFFVSLTGDRPISGNFFRNLVFFVIVCALL